MLLEQKTIPSSPLRIAVGDIVLQLTNAMDLSAIPQKLNESVDLGIDSILNDATNAAPFDYQCPAVRIAYPVEGYLTDASTNSMIWQRVPLQIYFIYYYGVPSQNILPTKFTELRDDHIRWNLEQLKDIRVKPNNTVGMDMRGKKWKFEPGQIVGVDHKTPLQYLDDSERYFNTLSSTGYSCSRVDLTILVLNH